MDLLSSLHNQQYRFTSVLPRGPRRLCQKLLSRLSGALLGQIFCRLSVNDLVCCIRSKFLFFFCYSVISRGHLVTRTTCCPTFMKTGPKREFTIHDAVTRFQSKERFLRKHHWCEGILDSLSRFVPRQRETKNFHGV